MYAASLSGKNQITLPRDIRRLLDVGPSDAVLFVPVGPGMVLVTAADKPVSGLFGLLKGRPRRRAEPATVEDMDQAVARRRAGVAPDQAAADRAAAGKAMERARGKTGQDPGLAGSEAAGEVRGQGGAWSGGKAGPLQGLDPAGVDRPGGDDRGGKA